MVIGPTSNPMARQRSKSPMAQDGSTSTTKTVWTWNAIGKRRGAWELDKDAPEATKGFLLNHLINELLPPKGDGYRWANSDPITGQAAWYDLRVNIEKAPEGDAVSEPVVDAQKKSNGAVEEIRYGLEWTK